MTLFRTLLGVDLVVGLFPPLHWWVSSDSPSVPLLYFVGSAALIMVSLPLLALLAWRDREGR